MNLKLWAGGFLLAILLIAVAAYVASVHAAYPATTTEQRLLTAINQEQIKQTRLLEDVRYELRRLNRK